MTVLTPSAARIRVARLLTELFAPIVLIVGLLLVVAVDSTSNLWQGLTYGLIAAFFAGLLPYAVLLLGVRRGRLGDRHLTSLKQRPGMMVIGLVSVTVGLVITRWLGAPSKLLALVVAMMAGVAVALAVSLFWKISIHSACAAGSVAILVVVFGATSLLAAPIVVAIAWARVVLGDHTVPQVVAGTAVGAVVAAGFMIPLT
jgi:hypothetical protein